MQSGSGNAEGNPNAMSVKSETGRPHLDFASELGENNAGLTAQIANAISMTNNMSSSGSGGGGGGGGGSASAMSTSSFLDGLERFLALQQQQQQGGGANLPPPAAPPIVMAGAPPPLSAPAAPPAATPVPGTELNLLSLLSSASNLLTPDDMALQPNDPNFFLPTPFAPGQSASSLQQRDEPNRAATGTATASMPPSAPTPQQPPAPQASSTNATMAAVAAGGGIPALGSQHQQFLQQLATAYGLGGGGPSFLPAAMAAASPVTMTAATGGQAFPQAFMNGLMPPPAGGMFGGIGGRQLANGGRLGSSTAPTGDNLNFGLLSGFPAESLNPSAAGMAGFPASFNPSIAAGLPPGLGLNSGLNPGMMAGFNIPGMSHLTTAGVAGGLTAQSLSAAGAGGLMDRQSIITSSSAASSPHGQAGTTSRSGGAGVPPSIPAPVPSSGVDATSAPSSGRQNGRSRGRGSSGGGNGDVRDPLIKSREARWIIRYNELLEFCKEHGHCRVPHGYASNRKLSWWVMNQRAQFAHRNQGKRTWLTAERIRLLDDVGFIWTPHLKRSGAGGGEKGEEGPDGSASAEEEDGKANSKDGKKSGRKGGSKEDGKMGGDESSDYDDDDLVTGV